MRKKILFICHYFSPSIKGGGLTTSLMGQFSSLSSDYDIALVAADRDPQDTTSYPDVIPAVWKQDGGMRTYRVPPAICGLVKLLRALRHESPDLYYLNGFFDPVYSIFIQLLWHLRLIPHAPLLIATHGEFGPGALKISRWKKGPYLWLYRLMRWEKSVTFHALTDTEVSDIMRCFPRLSQSSIITAANIPVIFRTPTPVSRSKQAGAARLVFLARIHPKKNLLSALKWLHHIKGSLSLEIYGIIEDTPYWAECQKLLTGLPSSIAVTYRGVVTHDRVVSTLQEHEFFIMPSFSEGQSHSIIEALAAGLPIIISDQCSVDASAAQAGWSLSLEDEAGFIAALQRCVDMGDEEYQQLRQNALTLAKQFTDVDKIKQQHIAMFDAAIAA